MNIQGLLQDYIVKRDQLEAAGGRVFEGDRRDLRSDYCNITISKDVLNAWIETIANNSAKEEFTRRFQEWDNKIQKGLISREDQSTLSESAFMQKVNSFYEKHQTLLHGECFNAYTDAKTALRTVLLPELKLDSPEILAQKYDITDEDILYRMKNEWIWKA